MKQFDPILVFTMAAIVVMLYCLWTTIHLKKNIPGGVVGKKWNIMSALVVMFTLGYFTTPFFTAIPEDILRFIVSLIFFFGAVYVLITVKLIYTIITELSE